MPLPIAAGVAGALLWVFKSRIGLFIASALVWMGINYGTLTIVLEPTIALLEGHMAAAQAGGSGSSGVGLAMWQWMDVLEFDRAASMIVSAYVTRAGVTAARLAWFKSGAGAS